MAVIDKQKIAASFSRAAEQYDSVAHLQQSVGRQLLLLLETTGIDTEGFTCIGDIGCGTGYFTQSLCEYAPSAHYLGIDIALGMLNFSRQHHNRANTHWLCADAESLPLLNQSVNLIFSSLALQWSSNLTQLFSELYRVLKPGGCLAFSTLGPKTLQELRTAWAAVDDLVHVNSFSPKRQWQGVLSQQPWHTLTEYSVLETLQYDRLQQLTQELKTLGAHNMNDGQRLGLTGRERIKQLRQGYEQYREQGKLPASYEVYYWVVQKAV